jgi:phospholipid transport system substrate-binding protein
MLYKFWKSRQGWKIYDLEIAGVSVVQTYRSQFDQVLRNGTFEDLLKELEKLGEK